MLFDFHLDLGMKIDKQARTLKFPDNIDLDALTPETLEQISHLLPRIKDQELDIELAAASSSNQM